LLTGLVPPTTFLELFLYVVVFLDEAVTLSAVMLRGVRPVDILLVSVLVTVLLAPPVTLSAVILLGDLPLELFISCRVSVLEITPVLPLPPLLVSNLRVSVRDTTPSLLLVSVTRVITPLLVVSVTTVCDPPGERLELAISFIVSVLEITPVLPLPPLLVSNLRVSVRDTTPL
jgi:hypothetical protein